MSAPSLVRIDDGSLVLDVPSCAMFSGSLAQQLLGTGHGEIEYANGSARRWIRFQRKMLTISGEGPVPHGIWDLDFAVDSWTVTVDSFNNDKTTEVWIVVPNRPTDTRDINTGRTSWSLVLNSANPE